jgi:predicted acylesterase/phospholipase RssA
MYTHLVIGGGGIKGCVITGALEAMNDIFNINRIKYIIGSSAGGVISLLLSLNFTPKEMSNIFLNINLTDYREIKVSELIKKFGVDDGKKVIRLIKAIILQRWKRHNYTFEELFKLTGKTLILTGSNISKNKIVYFSRYKFPNMLILDALRITICYPVLYQPVKLNGDYYIDGAALDNYPMRYFKNVKKKIGISLDTTQNKDKNENVHNITNILNYSDAVIFSIVDRYHAMKRDKYKDSTILIRLPSIHALEYGISYQTKLYLRNIGYKTTHNYLTKIIYGYNRIRLLKKYFKKFKS